MEVLKIWGKFFLLYTIICLSLAFGQNQLQDLRYSRQDYPRSGERYVTDQYGVIRMWVNVWGHVARPGSYLVYDGIDLATIISITGGPKTGANMRKVRVLRQEPDENGNLSYIINMKKFMNSGNRSDFLKVLPNDTYIVPQTAPNYILSQVGVVNTLMSVVNLYYLAVIRKEQSK
jgi:hypothetical protein